MDGFMPGNYHLPKGNTSMIANDIRATIGTKPPASLQTQDLQVGLWPVIKHIKLNGTIGQKLTHLQGLPTLTRSVSPHIQLGTLMILYQTMGPQMLSELMPFIIEKIFASWTQVQIASSLTMTPGLRIPTRFRSQL